MADSGGDSNTSMCEREVIERLFGGLVEDIVVFLLVGVSTAEIGQNFSGVVEVFRSASVKLQKLRELLVVVVIRCCVVGRGETVWWEHKKER